LLGLLLLLVGGATAFYYVNGNQLAESSGLSVTFIDALYMSIITITTVGFNEVVPQDQLGRLFTSIYLVLGWITLLFAGRYAVAYLVEAELLDVWSRKKMKKSIETLSGHTLVCGCGRMGEWAVRMLEARGEQVVLVELAPEVAEELARGGRLVVVGDASEDEVLLEARVDKARALIAAATTDADNALIVLSARSLNPQLIIAARASTEDAVPKLKKAGATRVLAPYSVAGRRLAMSVIAPGATEFLESAIMGSDDVLQELVVQPESLLVGQTLASSQLRQQMGLSVLAIRRGEEGFQKAPDPSTRIEAGDLLVVLGTLKQIQELSELRGIVEIRDAPALENLDSQEGK
jgi:voltage-gated potassium channel